MRQDVDATDQQIFQIGFEALQRHFRPEWLNHIDEIIAFRPLSSATMSLIFDRMLDEANRQYRTYSIKVEVSEAAKEYLLRKGYNPAFGVRPLRACLLKDMDAPLADPSQGPAIATSFDGAARLAATNPQHQSTESAPKVTGCL